jgi:hypothetical protein
MCADYAKFQMPVQSADTTPASAQEREELHRQLTAPGRVILDGSGQVRVEMPQTVQVGKRQVGAVFTEGGKQFVIVADGDKMEVQAAKQAGLYPTAPDIQPQDKSAENTPKQDEQKTEGSEQVRWTDATVDEVLGSVANELPASAINALVSTAVIADGNLTDFRAAEIAQQLPGRTPAEVKEMYFRAYEAAVNKANAMVQEAGVRDLASFYAWAEKNVDLAEVRYAFASDSAGPLLNAARQYIATNPNTPAHASLDEVYAEGHQVNGGRLYVENAKHMVEIGDMKMTFESAVQRGYVKVYEA